MIPYGKQYIDETDIAAVVAALKSDFLTQGPMVPAFEDAFAKKVGAKHAIAMNSGTAALHACAFALGIGPGDEVIVPPITFTATANCALFVGATPVFADVTSSGHIDPKEVEKKITAKTRAVIAVDFAGIPCDYERILAICERRGILLICDACHSLGATWQGKPIGSIGLLNCFSFHPVKHIATGEGGMVTTDDDDLAQTIRDFRTHGITKDPGRFVGLGADGYGGGGVGGYGSRDFAGSITPLHPHTPTPPYSDTPTPSHPSPPTPLTERGPWYYEMQSLGYNYRMPDINAALGLSQLGKLDRFVARRREIADRYTDAFAELSLLRTPRVLDGVESSWHLFPVCIDFKRLERTRTEIMQALREQGVGTQVHYIPVHLQPYYREALGTAIGLCPEAERLYSMLLSLPIFPAMTDSETNRVIESVGYVLRKK